MTHDGMNEIEIIVLVIALLLNARKCTVNNDGFVI